MLSLNNNKELKTVKMELSNELLSFFLKINFVSRDTLTVFRISSIFNCFRIQVGIPIEQFKLGFLLVSSIRLSSSSKATTLQRICELNNR